MLSPGNWHLRIPRGRAENAKWRKRLLNAAEQNPRSRDKIIEACRDDILFYVNAFAWTFHPKTDAGQPRAPQFITWPCQERLFRAILDHVDRQRDLVIEKSRDMGASWMCILALEWLWHFHPWTQSLVISRSEEFVDSRNPDSLFWKIDFFHNALPEWLMPKGYKPGKHRSKKNFENPANGSTITGQATTEKSGIGGRATVILVDEFSRIEKDLELLHGTADTADCRIFNSTHTGTGTAFYGLTKNSVTDKHVLHWSEHPKKSLGLYRCGDHNRVEVLDKSYEWPADFKFVTDGSPVGGPYPGLRSPWYDYQCQRRGSSRAVAMDLDINPAGSMAQFFDPHMIMRLVREYALEPTWEGDISYERDTGKPTGLIPSPSGPLKLWIKPQDQKVAEAPYVIGGDISTGNMKTPSCLSILDASTGTKVGEYTACHLDPKELAPVAVALCLLFKDFNGDCAKIVWEHAGPGVTFAAKMMDDLNFRNVYFKTSELPETIAFKVSDSPGWTNNTETCRVLLEDYREALALGLFLNRSRIALDECLQFRWDKSGNKIEHAEIESKDDPTGARLNHGDHVIADALAWKLCKERGLLKKEPEKRKEEIPILSLAWRRKMHEDKAKRENAWA